MSDRIRVLVVDDSALMRKLIPAILARESSIEVVGTAMDGAFALKKIEELQPDVVTLDLEMPRMDGMETLHLIMRRAPLPVILFSTHSKERGYATLKALALGAVDFLAKPKDAAIGHLDEIADQLIEKIKVAKHAAGRKLPPAVIEETPAPKKGTRAAFPPSEFQRAAQTRCNLSCRRFRRIFFPQFWSCSTCRKVLPKCSRSASMNAALLRFTKRVPAISSLPAAF